MGEAFIKGSGKRPLRFSYTGGAQSYEMTVDENGKDWEIKFKSSGKFYTLDNAKIDVFVVGGGGGGSARINHSGGAGGGGYTATQTGVPIYAGSTYNIIIGDGGAGRANQSSEQAGTGGTSSAFGVTANGGEGGYPRTHWYDWQTETNGLGGAGGSGGAGAAVPNGTIAKGGSDGTDGATNTDTDTAGTFNGGSGQGSPTRAFGEASGTLYSTGGDSRYNYTSSYPQSKSPNTGDGGDSGDYYNANSANTTYSGTNGGSGIVIIRNAR